MKKDPLYIIILITVSVIIFSACSSSKFIPDEKYLLDKVEIRSDEKGFDGALLEPYIRQKANSKWFLFFKVPLGTYALSGKDSTKWINRTLQNIGEKPILFDTLEAQLSCADLKKAMQNLGYLNATVDLKTKIKGKKIKATYTLHQGQKFYIDNVTYDIQDDTIKNIMKDKFTYGLKNGMEYSVSLLDNERKRITSFLQDEGYYRFHKDFIQYSADTVSGSKNIGITLHLMKYRLNNNSPETSHTRYYLGKINYLGGDSTGVHIRRRVLENNTAMVLGKPYSGSLLQKTYNNFARLQAVRYTNIRFKEIPDSSLLDCDIQISTNKPSSLSFKPEGTNTAGDLGAAASLTYTNRNIFKGSEQLSVELRGAYEAIRGLEGYSDQNYQEYSVETKFSFPSFVAPFLSNSFKRRQTAVSELSFSWNLQNRPEFHRRVFSAAWRYRWAEPKHNLNWRLDLLDLNYVYMPWISETFKHDYIDSVSNRNAILRYNYEDLFIMKIGFGVSYSNGVDAVRANIETAGNILNGLSKSFSFSKNASGQNTLFNIAYAQYAKFDFDYTHILHFDTNNALALHAGFGIAYPYGNSTVLPYEKRYFSGGANSVRGWSVRELGPGKFRGTDGRIDFINQTGDMKLDMNAEYRTYLFWKFNAAVFVDAGNIWTLRNYAEQPGGQFKFNTFFQQIAVAYGLGLRLNFDYFILRFDMGMKAINPAYETQQEHYAIFHPDFSRDFAFHFAVGLPF
nr:BamA/TamA family outer membrane protein [Prevotella sp.]